MEREFTLFDAFAKFIVIARDLYYNEPYLDPATWLAKWPEGKQRAISMSIGNGEKLCPGIVTAMVKIECLVKVPGVPRLIQYYFNLATQAHCGDRKSVV